MKADLFDPEDLERSLHGVDRAVFQVPEHLSQAKLTQARRADMLALIADNFARAAKNQGVREIIYAAQDSPENQECKEILAAQGIPLTTREAEPAEAPKQSGVLTPRRGVRSIQRITVPSHWSPEATADYYLHWLARTGLRLVKIRTDSETAEIGLHFLKEPLLKLEHDSEQSREDYFVYRIVGGKFVRNSEGSKARLTFRKILRQDQVFISIHDFEPALPWPLYVLTQAQVHLLAMKLFGLATKANGGF